MVNRFVLFGGQTLHQLGDAEHLRLCVVLGVALVPLVKLRRRDGGVARGSLLGLLRLLCRFSLGSLLCFVLLVDLGLVLLLLLLCGVGLRGRLVVGHGKRARLLCPSGARATNTRGRFPASTTSRKRGASVTTG